MQEKRTVIINCDGDYCGSCQYAKIAPCYGWYCVLYNDKLVDVTDKKFDYTFHALKLLRCYDCRINRLEESKKGGSE